MYSSLAQENETKVIVLPPQTNKKRQRKKKGDIAPPLKIINPRKVTKTGSWINQIKEEDLTTSSQITLLHIPFDVGNRKHVFIYSQIRQKINGYKHQDILKGKLDEQTFVDIDFVVQLLVRSQLQCFYCREDVFLLYKAVRDPKQWTLERVYNNKGHNRDNVEICCLSCNIKRRTMYHEKYKFTKQITFQKET